jgi:hypothetical protein
MVNYLKIFQQAEGLVMRESCQNIELKTRFFIVDYKFALIFVASNIGLTAFALFA